jgi:cytochrome bd-type quinol oxidase subunit 1
MPHIEFPAIGAKWAIGFLALFHTSVGSLGIGFAFFVTVAQVVAYLRKERRYDLLAKRVQLIHVCIYNIGTINAIGLVFALSGLYPQFWSQIFVQFYWTLIVEELLFFLLATTITFHYFFWDRLWGHKKLHIFLGSLLTPFFFLQIYIINALGGFMLTPGAGEAEVSLRVGILGWDKLGFFNPSLLMLHAHRSFANVAYGAFGVAGICGALLFLAKKPKLKAFYEDNGKLAFFVGFAAFLSLPIVGYFYSHVLKNYANEAFVNLMWGRGDVVAGGIDWWWLKQLVVATMFGMSLAYFRKTSQEKTYFTIPGIMVYSIALFYLMFYFAMGMIMTWAFFCYSLAFASGGAALAWHLINYHQGSPKGVYLLIGILSFTTVMLGGYSREASRPRFINRIAHYDYVFVPEERQPYLMVDVDPEDIPKLPVRPEPPVPVALIRERCIGCHTLDRVKAYPLENWGLIVRQMMAYGLKLTNQEVTTIVKHLDSKEPY